MDAEFLVAANEWLEANGLAPSIIVSTRVFVPQCVECKTLLFDREPGFEYRCTACACRGWIGGCAHTKLFADGRCFWCGYDLFEALSRRRCLEP